MNSLLHLKRSWQFTTEFNIWLHNNKWQRKCLFPKHHFIEHAEIAVSSYKETGIVSSAANTFIFLTQSNTPLPFDVYCFVCVRIGQVCIFVWVILCLVFQKLHKWTVSIFFSLLFWNQMWSSEVHNMLTNMPTL